MPRHRAARHSAIPRKGVPKIVRQLSLRKIFDFLKKVHAAFAKHERMAQRDFCSARHIGANLYGEPPDLKERAGLGAARWGGD